MGEGRSGESSRAPDARNGRGLVAETHKPIRLPVYLPTTSNLLHPQPPPASTYYPIHPPNPFQLLPPNAAAVENISLVASTFISSFTVTFISVLLPPSLAYIFQISSLQSFESRTFNERGETNKSIIKLTNKYKLDIK